MGFFSQLCEGCGHPLLSQHACTRGINDWMTDAVTLHPDGGSHAGAYDGYGRVGGAEEAVGYDATVYHRACWELAGKPTEWTVRSEDAPDQGYFFGDDEHTMRDPRTHPPRTRTKPQAT